MRAYTVTLENGETLPVEGRPVGPHLAVRKEILHKDTWWILDHTPTGQRVFRFPLRKDALLVGQTFNRLIGADLIDQPSTRKPQHAQCIAWGKAFAAGWTRLEFEAWSAEQIQQAAAKETAETALTTAKAIWEGKWITFVAGREYARCAFVQEVVAAGAGRIRAALRWERCNGGSRPQDLNVENITLGPAPLTMPLEIVQPGSWSVGHIRANDTVWLVFSAPSGRPSLANVPPLRAFGISRYRPVECNSLDEIAAYIAAVPPIFTFFQDLQLLCARRPADCSPAALTSLSSVELS